MIPSLTVGTEEDMAPFRGGDSGVDEARRRASKVGEETQLRPWGLVVRPPRSPEERLLRKLTKEGKEN